MSDDRRQGPDRRRHRRGGRRTTDQIGPTPLVMVVSPHAGERDGLRTALEERGYAVAVFESNQPALLAAAELLPDVIVAEVGEGVSLRGRVPGRRDGSSIPIVDLTGAIDALEEKIRAALGRRYS